ncbi:MAG: serine hydrolase [Marivirga sp.]|nr:serine hydrolase [Marivirga sp.]
MTGRRTFLKQLGYGSLGFVTVAYLPSCTSSVKTQSIAGVSPESLGVSSQGLVDFFDAVQKSGLEFHSIMINRNGKTILEAWWEPFKKEYIHTLYSLSKSFTSTAIGMLYDEKKLSTDDKVISFFPDKVPSMVSDNLSAMRIYDLLTMHTGHDKDTMGRIRASGEQDWVKAFLQLEVPEKPGSLFLYNTGATYMLSAIAQKVSGQNLMSYLKPRLFEPLGIVGADWEEDPNGINVGGYGLRIRTQDILNFGQLYLQKGQWNGKQLLSSAWIDDATKKQVNSQDNDSDWGQGYGYQFWRCKPGCYRGDGAYGQYCIIVPDKNAVIAITSETRDMGASMQLVWDHILPAIKEPSAMTLDRSVQEKLLQQVSKLSLPLESKSVSETSQNKLDKQTFTFQQNPLGAEKIGFTFRDDHCEVTFVENGRTIRVESGLHKWITNGNKKDSNTLFPIRGRTPKPTKISSYYHWPEKDTMVLTLKYVENAHADVFTFSMNEQGLDLTFNNSLSFQSSNKDERPALHAVVI